MSLSHNAYIEVSIINSNNSTTKYRFHLRPDMDPSRRILHHFVRNTMDANSVPGDISGWFYECIEQHLSIVFDDTDLNDFSFCIQSGGFGIQKNGLHLNVFSCLFGCGFLKI